MPATERDSSHEPLVASLYPKTALVGLYHYDPAIPSGFESRQVVKVLVHKQYAFSEKLKQHDIALLLLAERSSKPRMPLPWGGWVVR